MKWSCQTSKEEIIYLIKVFFPPLSPSANQNSSARERLSRSKEHSRILPDKCRRRGRGKGDKERNTEKEDKERRWGEEERDIANPLHIITAWSLSPPSRLCPHPHPQPPSPMHTHHRHRHTERKAWSPRGFRRDCAFPVVLCRALRLNLHSG